MLYNCWGLEDGRAKLQIGMNRDVLWERPRLGRGCSTIYGWMTFTDSVTWACMTACCQWANFMLVNVTFIFCQMWPVLGEYSVMFFLGVLIKNNMFQTRIE
jgi:hypothetical protein